MANTKAVACAYCAQVTEQITRDHVVPSTLWGGKGFRPKHPVVVPACGDCQHEYDSEAEYFRNCLVAMMDRGSHPVAERVLTGSMDRNLKKSKRAASELLKGLRLLPRMTPSGIMTGAGLGFQIDIVRINRVIEKIVRGIYYHKSRKRFPATHEVRVFVGNGFWEQEGFQHLFATMSGAEHQGDDVFTCRYVRDNTDRDTTAWLFVFYGKIGFFIWTQRIDADYEGKEVG